MSERRRLERLTSLRGLAAVCVVVFHFKHIGVFNLGVYTPLAWKGYLAVDFFFVLSGFILAYVHAAEFDAGRGDYRKFLGLRLARIYPVHVVTLGAAAIVVGLGEAAAGVLHSPASFASNLALVHGWGIHTALSWNIVAWSVSCEWLAYLTFPAHLFISRPLIGRPRRAIGACALSLALLGVVVAGILHRASEANPLDNPAQFGAVRCMFEFFAGVALFRAFDAIEATTRGPWPAIGALATVLAVAMLHGEWGRPILRDVVAVGCVSLAILAVALDRRSSGLLTRRWLVYLGEMSYSLYLVHGVVLMAFWMLFPGPQPLTFTGGAVIALLLVAIVFACAVASYELVEKPLRRRIRSWLAA